jgi:hypothetical protein
MKTTKDYYSEWLDGDYGRMEDFIRSIQYDTIFNTIEAAKEVTILTQEDALLDELCEELTNEL